MNDTLLEGPYRAPALVPASPWMSAPPPPAPRIAIGRDRNGLRTVTLATVSGARPWLWTVRARMANGWETSVLPGAATRWTSATREDPLEIVVSSVNRIGEERTP